MIIAIQMTYEIDLMKWIKKTALEIGKLKQELNTAITFLLTNIQSVWQRVHIFLETFFVYLFEMVVFQCNVPPNFKPPPLQWTKNWGILIIAPFPSLEVRKPINMPYWGDMYFKVWLYGWGHCKKSWQVWFFFLLHFFSGFQGLSSSFSH